MARLIRTEKEVEGRYEEVWLVVEEDALEQWPEGPREIVGRPAPRDRRARARPRRGAVHRRPRGWPGCCTQRCFARRTRTRAWSESTSRRRSRCPGVHAAIGPGEIPQLVDEAAATRARQSRPSAPTRRAGTGRARGDRRSSGTCSRSSSTRTRRCARESRERRAARARARRLRARARRGRRRRRGDVPHAERPAQLDGDAPGGRAVESATASRSTSRRSTSGACATRSPRRSTCRPTRCASVCEYMGGGFGSKNGAGRLHVHRSRAREADRAAGAVRADAPRGERRRGQPQRDDPAADASAHAATGR